MNASILFSKIVSLGLARSASTAASSRDAYHEQRREIRRVREDRLFLQVVDCDDGDLVGMTLSCDTVDVSANGLKVCSEKAVPVGAILDLWVDDSQRPGKFFLASRVRWSRGDSGTFQLGVELIESTATDIVEWRDRHA